MISHHSSLVQKRLLARNQPANSLESPCCTGVRTFARLPHVQTTDAVGLAVVWLPCDTGPTFKVGYQFFR